MFLKERWARGEATFGVWSGIDDPMTIQILGHAGFDFVSVDLQHSFGSMASLQSLLDALDKTPTPGVVRVSWNNPDLVMRALDLGAEGVIIPLVNDAEEARRAADACQYAPAGTRSFGPMWQEVRGVPLDVREADERATCIVMVETAAGMENLEAIANVDGVHAIYVGPNDLALSTGLGRIRARDSVKLQGMIERVVEVAHAAGKAAGLDCSGADDAHYWQQRGVDFLISAKDSSLLLAAAEAASAALRA